MSAHADPATVLIVEDERALAELFEQFLSPSYTVHTAADGREALERMDHEVDVVLLDRRMPGPSGEAVLRALRQAGYDCPVAMMTAVTPDVDVLEMDIDDYLVKPVDRASVLALVERLLELGDRETLTREYEQLVTKLEVLETRQNVFELVENETYERAQNRLDELEAELDRERRSKTESSSQDALDSDGGRSRRERRSRRGRDRPGRPF